VEGRLAVEAKISLAVVELAEVAVSAAAEGQVAFDV
jgi:hypothetical protein